MFHLCKTLQRFICEEQNLQGEELTDSRVAGKKSDVPVIFIKNIIFLVIICHLFLCLFPIS